MNNGQVAFEFLSFIVMAMLIALVLLASINSMMRDTNHDRMNSEIKSFGKELQGELILASKVHEGYFRSINIPEKIRIFDYEINNTNMLLILSSDGTDFPFPIPNITGDISKGNITIRNIGGLVVVE